MGQSFGKIASSVGSGGSVLGGVGKIFNPNSDEVTGTGQTVGDLKKQGFTPQDIQTLGGGHPSLAVGLARGMLGGGLNQLAQQQRNPFYGGY